MAPGPFDAVVIADVDAVVAVAAVDTAVAVVMAEREMKVGWGRRSSPACSGSQR